MSWKVYKWNGRFIQGDLVSTHSTESAAMKKAKKEIDFVRTNKEETKEEIVIWLDAEDGTPRGAIVKKNKVSEIRGRKRIRQSKKKE
jgi:outer membrane lipoprotein-sorting protein